MKFRTQDPKHSFNDAQRRQMELAREFAKLNFGAFMTALELAGRRFEGDRPDALQHLAALMQLAGDQLEEAVKAVEHQIPHERERFYREGTRLAREIFACNSRFLIDLTLLRDAATKSGVTLEVPRAS